MLVIYLCIPRYDQQLQHEVVPIHPKYTTTSIQFTAYCKKRQKSILSFPYLNDYLQQPLHLHQHGKLTRYGYFACLHDSPQHKEVSVVPTLPFNTLR